MISRFAPIVSLALVVGCPQAAPPAQTPTRAPDVARWHPPTRSASPPQAPPRAATLREAEALPGDPNDAIDHVMEGEALMSAGRAQQAVGAYRTALSLDDSAEVWRRLGEAHLAAGDDVRGAACLEEAVAIDTGLVVARKALVKHRLANNQGFAARVHAEELVRQQPLDASSRQMLGRAFMQERRWKEAIGAFQIVLSQEPDNIFAHNNIGYSALQVGSLELAREHLERTLSLEPQEGYMLNNLGVTYERLGRAAEAHAAFSRAAELSPRYAQAQLNRDRLHADLSHDQRIVSSQTLLELRAALGFGDEAGGDLLHEAMDAAAGGAAR